MLIYCDINPSHYFSNRQIDVHIVQGLKKIDLNEAVVATIKSNKRMTQLLYHLDVTSNADMLTSMISALLDVTLVAFRPPFSHAHDTSMNTSASTEMLINLLCGVFQSLDTDNDGYLTAADFSAQGTHTS